MASGAVTPGAISATDTRPRPVSDALAGGRWEALARGLAWGAFGVILVLAGLAPIVRTGDAHQYYAMATALADLRPPALTSDEVAAFKAWLLAQPTSSAFPNSVGMIDQPPLVVAGRQELSHFWLYPLLVAPVIALTDLIALHPGYAFLAVNAALLGLALWQVQRAYSAVVALFLLASPLIWFVNKAQVEIFTVALLAIAMAQARRGRWLEAGLAAAVAATQNVPILAAVACFWAAGLLQQQRTNWRPITRRGLALVAATLVIGALHPAYYLWRLGVPTPQRLNGGINLRLPSPEQYLAVLLDPDLGLLPWLPLFGLLALTGLVVAFSPLTLNLGRTRPSPPRIGGPGRLDSNLRLTALCALVIGAGFLFAFAQTTNVNSGGTVHISRYALWLLPLGLPFLAATAGWLRPRLTALLPAAGALAVTAYAIAFQPAQPELYLNQSPQATFVTTWLPELYRPVPEIFAERQRHQDGRLRGSAATADCHVLLLLANPAFRDIPCRLTPAEATAANRLFAAGWQAAWITRPGPLALTDGGVAGVLPPPWP